jgi:hypothetical protein
MLGCNGIAAWESLEAHPLPASATLHDSGYAIHRDGRNWLLFDAGPVAHGLHADSTPSTAHGHLDALQILYWRDGAPLLVDGGMPFYFGDPDWVRHFRGPAAHNTLQIEGIEFARDAGGLAWAHASAITSLDARFEDGDWVCAGSVEFPSRRGRNGQSVRIEREVRIDREDDSLSIRDRVCLDRPRQIRWHWRLGAIEAARAVSRGPIESLIATGQFQLQCRLEHSDGPTRIEARLIKASGSAPEGHIATEYGVCNAGIAAVVQAEPARQIQVTTRIQLRESLAEGRIIERAPSTVAAARAPACR